MNNFVFTNLTSAQIEKELLSLNEVPGLDVLNMDRRLLRLCATIIAPSLSYIFNQSLVDGVVPTDFKLARVTPVYKNGEDCDISNHSDYRPISVICHIAKIFERLVKNQLLTFLNANDLLSHDQSGYLKDHSTQTSLHRVIEDWLENINEGEFTGACIFDISKCFDTINHRHLLFKLDKYGIRGDAQNWFKSYLSDRRQVVSLHNTLSSEKNLNFGVPQGSLLGPFLFLLFINDIQNFSTNGCVINLFADDLILYCSSKCLNELQRRLQSAVNSICDWYKRNRLKVNPKKSKLMVIGTPSQISLVNKDNFKISYDGSDIPLVREAKYLGLTITSDLSWDKHISSLCRGLMYKISVLRQLQKSGALSDLVASYLLYGIYFIEN